VEQSRKRSKKFVRYPEGAKSENPRSEVLHIRLTLEEKENLEKYPAKHNLFKTR